MVFLQIDLLLDDDAMTEEIFGRNSYFGTKLFLFCYFSSSPLHFCCDVHKIQNVSVFGRKVASAHLVLSTVCSLFYAKSDSSNLIATLT